MPAGSAATAPAFHTPVVVVHGYGGCQNVTQSMEGPFAEQYYTGTAAADLHLIAYYGCDVTGESIQGYGPLNGPACISADPTVRVGCPANLRSPDNDYVNTDFRRFSYELAWYLFGKFGASTPVDLVGHSMGGLIITYAIQQIAAHNPSYPSSLSIQTVVSFSTPFAGGNLGTANYEARQMAPTGADSVVAGISAAGAKQMYAGKYTLWAAEGSSGGCDVFPSSSSLALPRETFTMDYTTPCYSHSGYLWDAFQPVNATGKLNGAATTTGYHSLDLMHYVIGYQESTYNH
jgi:pimeloyl-ACP methyl ester carboxylesterase